MHIRKNNNAINLILILVGATLNAPMLINNIAVSLLLLYFIMNYKQFNNEGSTILYLLPILILIFDFLSVFNSTDYKSALKILEKRSVLLIFPIVFLYMPKVNNRTLSLIFKYFIYSLTIVCSISLVLAFIENYKKYGFSLNYQSLWIIGHHNLSYPIGFHATYLSNYILFALSIIAFYKHKTFNIKKFLRIAIVVILLLCFLLLSVRTAFVSFIILIFYLSFYIYKKNRLKLILGLLASALIIALIFFNNTMLKERTYDVFSIGKSKRKVDLEVVQLEYIIGQVLIKSLKKI